MVYESFAEKIAAINPILAESIMKNPWILPMMIIQIVLKLIFYPIALYKSAVRKQKAWFVVLFIGLVILNDFALLPILYLIFAREKPAKMEKIVKKTKKKKKY